MARPTDYTPELASLICERIAEGESLRAVCLSGDTPSYRTVMRWLAAGDKDLKSGLDSDLAAFCHNYARAREAQADADADRLTQIADDVLQGRVGPAEARAAADILKWTASRRNPRKYGDKQELQHTGAGGTPLQPPVFNIVGVKPNEPGSTE